MSTVLLPWGRGLDQRQRKGKVTATDFWTGKSNTIPSSTLKIHWLPLPSGVLIRFMPPYDHGHR